MDASLLVVFFHRVSKLLLFSGSGVVENLASVEPEVRGAIGHRSEAFGD